MITKIIKQQRDAMQACDECGFWSKRLIEIKLDRSPMRALLCPSCAGKVSDELNERLPWKGGRKEENKIAVNSR